MVHRHMERHPLDGNAHSLEPGTQLSENVVSEALIARRLPAVTKSMLGSALICCARAVT